MTPFGERMHRMREEKGVTQKEMAAALGVSAAYLSALEHGRRGVPSWPLIQKIVGYFNVIWDDAEELQQLAASSHPRVVVDTVGLSPQATLLANRLAGAIGGMPPDEIAELIARIDEMEKRGR